MELKQGNQIFASLALFPLLTSCSYVFDVRAVAIDGYVAFVVAPGSSINSDCVTSITVETDGPKAEPARGDDAALVAVGVYRQQSVAHEDDCRNPFPIFYSRSLKGHQRRYSADFPGPEAGRLSSAVATKPLRIGVVYQVAITAGATGYGGGRFRLRADRTIENIPREGAAK